MKNLLQNLTHKTKASRKMAFYKIENARVIDMLNEDLTAYMGPKSGINLYPTRTCFHDMYDFVVKMFKVDEKWFIETFVRQQNIGVVHALLKHGQDYYAHAWIELQNGLCIQSFYIDNKKVFAFCITQEYRTLNSISYEKKYSLKEFQTNIKIHKYAGPWEENILKHCPEDEGSTNPEDITREADQHFSPRVMS